ncbi:ATP-binding protein [Actinokineospora globicatena]|uniref:ATP-binding protein n=1 Tax=Actinokineospora globicatena TaxID=103729 RepID=UPI0020A37BB0|nr:LuxR family transcriptional regulator [Actinokineospora globicatena]MCP2306572.1 regulatory protein, luxR family [Actinokineospora globicatena]
MSVGHVRQRRRLDAAVDAVRSGRGRVLLVEGEPGIGKTTLVRAATDRAQALGYTIKWGYGDELGQDLPLLPVLDALRGDDPRLASADRLLRGETGATDPVAAASRQLQAIITDLCATAPTVLVVDDLQWADRATAALWCRLARLARDLPLLVLGMTRLAPRGTELLAIRRAAGSGIVPLDRLDDGAVTALVSDLVAGTPGTRLLALADGAAGNPLYLTELVDALRRSGAIAAQEGEVELTGDLAPGSLGAAIAHRLDFLPEKVRGVLGAAALLGVEFDPADVAAVIGERVTDVIEALEEARAAGVLRESADRLAFRHPLIRSAIHDDLPVAVRAVLHRDAAVALAGSGAPIRRVARQYLRAVDLSGTARLDAWSTAWLVEAAPALIAQSPALAVRLLGRAVRGDGGPLAARLADARYRTGDASGAEEVAHRALAVTTDPDLIVDLHWTLAQCRALAGRSRESLTALAEACVGLPDRHRARLLVLIARAHRDLGEVDLAGVVAARALAAADNDQWTIGWALHVLTFVAVMRGDVAAALPLFDRALAVTDAEPALLDLRLLLQINQAVAFGDVDRYPEAIAAATAVRTLAEQAGGLVRLAQSHSALGELLFDVGRWDDAVTEVTALADEVKDPGVACCDHGNAALIALHRGDPDTGAAHLAAAAEPAKRIGNRVIGSLALARALDHERRGQADRALAGLLGCLSESAQELEEMEDLLPETVRLALAQGDLTAAEYAAGLAEKVDVSVAHRLGAAAFCRGLIDRDPVALAQAGEHYLAAGRPFARGRALHAAAIVLAEAGNSISARAAFSAADDLYDTLGAAWDAAGLRSALHAHGIRRGPRVRHRVERTGWGSLTPTETRVAALVAQGLSNPAIADRLVLSRRTVATHVSHILAKLGMASRTEIAREAAAHYRESG